MHSFQSEDDYPVPHSMTAHSESLEQVARKFPYDHSYDTYVLSKDKLVPHSLSKEKKTLLRRTQSNPEGACTAEWQGEGLQMSHLPALKDKKTALRMGKRTDQTALAMTSTRANELSVLTAKMHGIPETTESTCRMSPVGMRNTHKKLERSKTTPVTLLKPVVKTNPVDYSRRRVHLAVMNPRGYAINDQHCLPSCTPSDCEGRIYGTMDTHGIFKELEKTYDSPEMTRTLPNSRRFGAGRVEERNTPPSPKIRAIHGGYEKRVQAQGKFTRAGQLIAGLQFIDGNNEDTIHETQEKNTDDSLELTYLRFTKERQEDNRI